jgi:biopolymer transport protein ExbD
MPEVCLNPYGCEWGIGYLWRWMNWIGRADVCVLAILLTYSVAAFLGVSWRYCRAQRARGIDRLGRRKLVADLSTVASGLKSIAFAAPYLGLAGTCFGIMGIFVGLDMEIHAAQAIMAAILAAALVTTAAGILVAVSATCFYNYLGTRIELLEGEILNQSIGCRLPLRKRFSEFPFALIAAPTLAMGIAALISFASFHEPKGLVIGVASARCEYDGNDRPIVLRITEGRRLFLNSEQQNWSTLTRRLGEVYSLRVHHILYLSADDGVPFQTVADAIDITENTGMGPNSLNIAVQLITPKAVNAPCLEPVRTSFTQHASR